ncbi:unnamed protein product [Ilex paraguariensis]|uniref:Uncharacterized protein n=1 Tax=Ilex paraguariensis TaxID=185542 RepID=A0ABC8S7B0_9AQUA
MENGISDTTGVEIELLILAVGREVRCLRKPFPPKRSTQYMPRIHRVFFDTLLNLSALRLALQQHSEQKVTNGLLFDSLLLLFQSDIPFGIPLQVGITDDFDYLELPAVVSVGQVGDQMLEGNL